MDAPGWRPPVHQITEFTPLLKRSLAPFAGTTQESSSSSDRDHHTETMSLQDVVSNLRAEIETSVDSKPMVKVHAKEWEKVRRRGLPATAPRRTPEAQLTNSPAQLTRAACAAP